MVLEIKIKENIEYLTKIINNNKDVNYVSITIFDYKDEVGEIEINLEVKRK